MSASYAKKTFSAEPINLAIACKRCNGNKKQKNVLSITYDGDLSTIPSHPDDYTIPHPHLTVWAEHMSHTSYLIYEGKTEKGRNLLDVCELRTEVEKAVGAPIGGIKAAIATSFFNRVRSAIPDVGDEEAIRLAASASEAVEEVRFSTLEAKLTKDLAGAERQVKKRQKLYSDSTGAS